MDFGEIFNKKLKLKIYFTMMLIAVLYASFGTWYIILGMKFTGEYIWHLAGSVGGLTVIALIADYFFYNLYSKEMKKYLKTEENVKKAYGESMNFPLKYSLTCMASYYFVVLGAMTYMGVFTDVGFKGIVNVLIGGFIVATPGGMTVFLVIQDYFNPVIKFLFRKSKINSFENVKGVSFHSIKLKTFLLLVIIATNAFVAVGAFFIYTLLNLGLPPEIYYSALRNILIISGFNLLITFVAAFFYGRYITLPMKVLESNMKSIAGAKGDLTQKADVTSDDEIGMIAGWFNTFLENMRKLVLSVRESSDKVGEVAESLSALTEEVNASSEEVTSTINDIAVGANNQLSEVKNVVSISENIEKDAVDVLSATNKAERIIGEVVSSALDGKEKATSSVKNAEKLVSQTDKTVNAMRELSDKVEQIASIAETIGSISVQTNLLALNAAIESARAGEAGTGFGVIAQEIRNLNDETNTAAQKIAEIISDIHQSTGIAIGNIESVSQQVNLSKETIESSTNILQQIANNVGEADEAVKKISQLAQSQRDSLRKAIDIVEKTAEIAESNASATQEVSASSEEQASSMEEMADSAQILTTYSLKLRELMNQFNA
jgi:methyl-accepting chemotaxis protein